MPQILDSRCVLAVCDLKQSTDYYINVLGFQSDSIEAEGWSFLSRDGLHIMLGECPDEQPASELGNHSYFLYLEVQGLDEIYQDVKQKGAEILFEPADKPWGMREFGVRTIDGHRIMFGQDI